MTAEHAFDKAVKGVSGICHMASDLSFSDKPDEVIPAVVKGARDIITAATKERDIKSVVYTSSSTAAVNPQPNNVVKVTQDTWNDNAVEVAYGPNPDGWNVYGASKTEAERAIWKEVKKWGSNPPFQIAAVLPNLNLWSNHQAGRRGVINLGNVGY